jgi:hypothetical protein
MRVARDAALGVGGPIINMTIAAFDKDWICTCELGAWVINHSRDSIKFACAKSDNATLPGRRAGNRLVVNDQAQKYQ